MPLMSPGGQLAVLRPILAVVRAATLLLLLTLTVCTSEKTSDSVVIEIGNIQQPPNCSLFLNNLEVTRIITYVYSGRRQISTYNLPEDCKIKYKITISKQILTTKRDKFFVLWSKVWNHCKKVSWCKIWNLHNTHTKPSHNGIGTVDSIWWRSHFDVKSENISWTLPRLFLLEKLQLFL